MERSFGGGNEKKFLASIILMGHVERKKL